MRCRAAGCGAAGICCTLQSDSSYLEWTHGIIQAIRNWTRGGNLKVVGNLYEYKYCTHSVKRLALTRPAVMPSAMSRTPPPYVCFPIAYHGRYILTICPNPTSFLPCSWTPLPSTTYVMRCRKSAMR